MDFYKDYLDYIEEHRQPKHVKGMHKHHIIPRHAGGADDKSNLVSLFPAHHAIAHLLRYAAYGDWGDFLAFNALQGFMTNAEAKQEAIRQNGLDQVKQRKGIHSQTTDERREFGKRLQEWLDADPERREMSLASCHAPEASKKMARTKTKWILVAPDGAEYESPKDAERILGADAGLIQTWGRRGNRGWTRRLKQDGE